MFKIVMPHFTLVFAIAGMPEADLVEDVGQQVASVRKIAFELNLATVSRDPFGSHYHEFLVPTRLRSHLQAA